MFVLNSSSVIYIFSALLGLCSVIALYVFIQKQFTFHREQVNVTELVSGLVNVLRRNAMIEAITLCDHTPGPVSRMLASAIRAYQNKENIKEALEAQSIVEVPRLESLLNVLATIAYISPLLGLLGTVFGLNHMINSDSQLNYDLSGLRAALHCTVQGLCVCIPCHIAYNYLVSRVQTFCFDMERASAEIMYFFQKQEKEDANHEK